MAKQQLTIELSHGAHIVKLSKDALGRLSISKGIEVGNVDKATIAEIMGSASIAFSRDPRGDVLTVVFAKCGNRVKVNGMLQKYQIEA